MRSFKNVRTVSQAYKHNSPKISFLSKYLGDLKIEAYIKLWLVDLNMVLDLKKPLNKTQIDTIAFNIVDRFRSLNLADINLVFQNAKNGIYGETYDRISTPTVLKWFHAYNEERTQLAIELSRQQHIQHKSAFTNAPRGSEATAKGETKKAMNWYLTQHKKTS